jgi:hypothetical protein
MADHHGCPPGRGVKPGQPLKRTGALQRGTPLRSAPIPRTTAGDDLAKPSVPKPRGGGPVKPGASRFVPKPRQPRTGPTEHVQGIVRDRDGGLCVRCGAPATDLDHVMGRGMGGAHGDRARVINGPAWLRTLCGRGNTSGCHGWKESNAGGEPERLGYRIRRNALFMDASKVPCLTRWGWVLFTNEGKVLGCQAPGD